MSALYCTVAPVGVFEDNERMKLTLVFPTYNEAGSIIEVLEGFSRYCESRQLEHELIVVNDGSTDGTPEKVRGLVNTRPSIKLINLSTNLGYGAALRSGFAAATGDFIFFTDSDGQFKADDLDQTLPLMHSNTIVLGYRQPRVEGSIRRLNAWLWAQCIRITLGFRVRDLNCAWKVFPRTFLTGTTLVSNGAFISAEILYWATKKRLRFQEIPVHHYPRQAGSATGANPQVAWRALRELVSFLL